MTHQQTILIVDDEPPNLDLLVNILSSEQYRILVAEGGKAALQRAEYGQPDLILLDVRMPDMDGFNVCRRLKEIELTRHIPIIFLTADKDPDHLAQAFELGAVDYVTKPIQQAELLARVKNHLAISAAQAELSQRVRERTAELEEAKDQLEERVAARSRELAALYDMTILFAEAHNLTDILEPALQNICKSIDGSAITVHNLVVDKNELRLAAHVTLNVTAEMENVPLTPVFSDWLRQADAPVMLVGKTDTHPFLPLELVPSAYQTYLGITLRVRNEVIGMLGVYRDQKRPFSVKNVSLLITMAEQLGIIIQNHRLHEQSQRMTQALERQRLARELHDSVAQRIYSLNLFARAGRDALTDGDLEDVQLRLRQLEDNARFALREMRLLLYQLRPLALENQTLVAAFEERFALVEDRLGIETEIHGNITPTLAEEVEEELYFIITEALNNALKHAQATRVDLTFASRNGRLLITICDNGRGFDLEESLPGLGLENMRSRAAQIKGELTIETAIGKGTTIGITV